MSFLYLIRHAKAASRRAWTEPDRLRPLSRPGRRQAEALPAHLGERPIASIVSSPHVRCVQTVEPLGETHGVEVEPLDELAEGVWPTEALRLLLALAQGGSVAACSHGDVLLGALADLRAAGVPLAGPLECRKASTWIVQIEGTRAVSGRYLAPPALPEAEP